MKRISLILSTILIVAVLAISFTGCLKIGLQKKNVTARIEDNGGTFVYSQPKACPVIDYNAEGHTIEDIIVAKLPLGEEEHTVYVLYCGTDKDAEWVKKKADEYLVKMREEQKALQAEIDAGTKFIEFEEVVDYEHWISYQYERTIICGYSKAVAVIRTY